MNFHQVKSVLPVIGKWLLGLHGFISTHKLMMSPLLLKAVHSCTALGEHIPLKERVLFRKESQNQPTAFQKQDR